MRIRLLFLPLLVVAVNPLVAETRVENGVRVHRMDSAASLARQDSAEERSIGRVSIGLDRTFGASPSCASMDRSEEHTSELQSLMRISYAVFCLKKKKKQKT